ncbi:MAG: hypothetical protein NTV86_10615 [Planctomycetota bacterium]|nr:hypothetical protein [Planctomycetota bacterium]
MFDSPEHSFEDVIRKDGRYPREAFAFMQEGLNRAVKKVHGDTELAPGKRHVTGRQLCLAMRELAVDNWGLLARLVLQRWNIRATIDFGNMVYLLIEHDLMAKTEEDSIEDFRDVFDFAEAFELDENFQPTDG